MTRELKKESVLLLQRAIPPSWTGTWDATYFRPACPQKLDYVQKDIPTFTKANISEDCLYMNIFVPNVCSFLCNIFVVASYLSHDMC